MKKLLILISTFCIVNIVNSQYVYTIKADSVKITNNCDTAELILENHTQNVLGFLYNKGKGRTEFRKVIKLNDSTLIFGEDTLVIQGSASRFWNLTGNAGTNPANNFVGTTDSTMLIFRTQNIERMRITPTGTGAYNNGSINFGITAPSTRYKLQVGVKNIDPAPSLVPGVTGGLISSDEGSTRITALTAGANFDRPFFTIVKANGTLAAPTAVTSGSRLGGMAILGYDGTAPRDAAGFDAWIDGTPSFGIIPTALIFYTSPSTGGIPERMRIAANGNIGIGTSAPFHKLDVRDANNSLFLVQNTSAFSATSGGFVRMSNSGTPSAAGFRLGGLHWGSNPSSTNFRTSAVIQAFSEAAWTDNSSQPTYLAFETTASGSNTSSERMRIAANGNVGVNTTSPANRFHVAGTGRFDSTLITTGRRHGIRTLNSSTTLADTDEFVFADANGGAFTVTLPNSNGRDGQVYTIKKIDASANAITINTTSSQTIDNATSHTLSNQWDFVTVIANGGNWLIVAKN